MPNTHSTLTSLFSDIADAIREKTGSSETIVADDFPTAIANIPAGGGGKIITTEVPNSTGTGLYIDAMGYSSETDPVRFIDYDGTILYSYSVEDFAALTAMPENPTHDGLTSQGWNWTLTDAKTHVADCGKIDIGQMYITDDNKTRIYISLTDPLKLSPYIGVCPNGTVIVDWGDNATDTLTGAALAVVKRAQHTYASTGDYIITITASSGTYALFGVTTYGSYLLTKSNTTDSYQKYYQNSIKKIELGANVSIGNYGLYQCQSLATITIPNGITGVGTNAFYNCYALKSITLPSGFTTLNAAAFGYCYSLATVMLPKNITYIGTGIFNDCKNLQNVVIPSGVTTVSQSMFGGCCNLQSITLPNSITTIGNSSLASCFSLNSIRIPNNVTTIDNSAFNTCQVLTKITIPSLVTSIGSNAFASCYSVAEYHFLSTTPPTLANTNAFSSIPSDCKIYVPSASLTTYKGATNWSTYASKMVGE